MAFNDHIHCWHPTGKYSPATAPRSTAEFRCCDCGEQRWAEQWVATTRIAHGEYLPSGGLAHVPWAIS